MNNKYKLGLTRSRVFALENCVYFSGVMGETVDVSQFEKALSLLCEKYPLLLGTIELCEDGTAYVAETLSGVPFTSVCGDADETICEERRRGFDFSKELFRAVLINGNTVALFGHTAVCDVNSLALLSGELMRFYKRESFDIDRREPELFSEKSDLPDNVTSGVAERIANTLNFAWIKHDRFFTYSDYTKAAQAYSAARPRQNSVSVAVKAAETEAVVSRCHGNNTDVSAAAAYCVYAQLAKGGFLKRDRHVLWQCNERFFLSENEVRGIGPYNSAAAVKVPRSKKKGLSPFDAFQDETYKKHATCFSVFYDNVYHMEILPQLCDAANLYEAGTFKNRTAKSLAEKEFNMRNCALGCGFLNFDQQYWAAVKCFESVAFSEPFSRRSQFYLNISLYNGELKLELTYRNGKLDENKASNVLENAVKMLKELP